MRRLRLWIAAWLLPCILIAQDGSVERALITKLKEIFIPEVNFRESRLEDIMAFLAVGTPVIGDPTPTVTIAATGDTVTVVFACDALLHPTTAPRIPEQPVVYHPALDRTRISLTANGTSVYEILQRVARQAGLRISLRGSDVVLTRTPEPP